MIDELARRRRVRMSRAAGPALLSALLFAGRLTTPPAALAQATSPPEGSQKEDRGTDAFRPKLIFLPFVYYTPETKLALGAGGVLNFRAGKNKALTRTSTVWIFGNYTLAKQFQVSVVPQVYFEKNSVYLSGNLRYERTPQRFYGIGNDTPSSLMESYTPRIALFQAGLKKKLLGSLYAGLLLDLEQTNMESVEPGGILETAGIPGSRGGLVSGAGISFDWDTRDNVQFPRHGSFFQLAARAYGPVLGSEFAFSSLNLDFRKYASPASGQVLALQAVLRLTSGDTPFYRLSMLGGDSLLRGYYKGRFRDKDMIVVQAEYRVSLGRRFGAAGFAGLGQVFPRFSDLELQSLRYSMGTGLRYSLNPREGTNIRMDLAWGVRSFGLYFTAQESF
ncbi:MAG: BamA/TamA family outer membrane protein [Candidatus Aminicenantes bacterium]